MMFGKHDEDRRGARALGLVLATWLAVFLAACTAVDLPAEAMPPAAAETETPVQEDAEEPTDMAPPVLTFEGNGDTFLARMDAARAELGEVLDHRYVAVEDGEGYLWQGEVLRSADRQLLFLQQAGSGGQEAVRMELAPAADPVPVAANAVLPAVTPMESPTPEIRFVRARFNGESWSFDVTLAYPDTGWEDYADGWHVETPDQTILATRVLLHPHVNEQPFTRSLGGVTIPAEVETVHIRAHDLVSGYGVDTLAVPIAQAGEGDRYAVER